MPRRNHQFFFPGAPQAVYGPPIGVVTPGQGVGYDRDAVLFWAGAGVNPSQSRKREISDLVTALKSTYDSGGVSLWDSQISIYMPGIGVDDYGSTNADDRTLAKRDLKGNYHMTEVDGGNLSFTTDVGFKSNAGTAYLDTGFAPSTANHALYQRNQAGFWAILSTPEQSATNSVVYAGTSSRLGARFDSSGTANSIAFGVNDSSLGSVINVHDASGLIAVARTGSLATDCKVYKGRVLMPNQSNAGASEVMASTTIRFLANGTTRVIPTLFAAGFGKALDLTGYQGISDAFIG